MRVWKSLHCQCWAIIKKNEFLKRSQRTKHPSIQGNWCPVNCITSPWQFCTTCDIANVSFDLILHIIFIKDANLQNILEFYSLSLAFCDSGIAGWFVTWAVRVPTMTCRWQSRASSQNCRAARHTEVNRSQHRERLLLETSSHWTGLRIRQTQDGLVLT